MVNVNPGNIGDMQKPVTKLIETIRDCVGTIWEPYQIKRIAGAKAEALIIMTKAEVERDDIRYRAVQRLALQETHRQENIENIVNLATTRLPESVSKKPVDHDWVFRFFDDCKDVSNTDLQQLWASILAEEVTTPGKTSRKTLSVLKDLSRERVISFNCLCSLIWHTTSNDGFVFPIDNFEDLYTQLYLGFDELLKLQECGLILCSANISISFDKETTIRYGKLKHNVSVTTNDKLWGYFHFWLLTQAGNEICNIVGCKENNFFYNECLKIFSSDLGVNLQLIKNDSDNI